jgi:hypothetical protein
VPCAWTVDQRCGTHPRLVTARPHAHHEAMQMARQRQHTQECTERSATRAGGEGPIAHGVQACDLRRSRSSGSATTHRHPVLTATAMHVARLFTWLMGDSPGGTRISRVAALVVSVIHALARTSAHEKGSGRRERREANAQSVGMTRALRACPPG